MAQYDPERITYIGMTDARGTRTPFGIRAKDRTKHMYVIGKSGMGKSTLLENLAVQDIQNNEGFAFIDPHGGSAEELMRHIPESRIDDVFYFNPSDTAHPVAFNIMEDVHPDQRHLVVSGLMSVFKKIWVDAWSARMEYILQNTLAALLEYPGSTLLGVNRMLSDKGYREKVVDNVQDPSVKSFWVDEFAKYNERYMQEAGDSIKNKIGQFTANPILRNIVGQTKSSFDMRKIMDEGKIVIMNLSKGLIGETNTNMLGSMLTTRIYLSAMSRANLSPTEMAKAPNFYFYVDEFQSFANATFANILSEARKYKLNLTIAHQYIDQMDEDVRNAVFGNVGTTISFRVGPFDAEVLEKIFSPEFEANDLVSLTFAQIYLSLMIDGVGSRPFSATTLPPIKSEHSSYLDMVLARSREKYARPRAEVESEIDAFYKLEFTTKKDERDREKRNNKPSGDFDRGGARDGGKPQRPKRFDDGREEKSGEVKETYRNDLRMILSGIKDDGSTKKEDKTSVKEEEKKKSHNEKPVTEGVVASTRKEQKEGQSDTRIVARDTYQKKQQGGPKKKPSRRDRGERDPQERQPKSKQNEVSEQNNALREALAHLSVKEKAQEKQGETKEVIRENINHTTSLKEKDDVKEVESKSEASGVSAQDAPNVLKPTEEKPAQSPQTPEKTVAVDKVAQVREHLEERVEALSAQPRAPHEVTPKQLARMMHVTIRDKKPSHTR